MKVSLHPDYCTPRLLASGSEEEEEEEGDDGDEDDEERASSMETKSDVSQSQSQSESEDDIPTKKRQLKEALEEQDKYHPHSKPPRSFSSDNVHSSPPPAYATFAGRGNARSEPFLDPFDELDDDGNIRPKTRRGQSASAMPYDGDDSDSSDLQHLKRGDPRSSRRRRRRRWWRWGRRTSAELVTALRVAAIRFAAGLSLGQRSGQQRRSRPRSSDDSVARKLRGSSGEVRVACARVSIVDRRLVGASPDQREYETPTRDLLVFVVCLREPSLAET